MGNQASLVWYDTPERIAELSELSNEKLTEQIHRSFPKRLGAIKVHQHGAFPLTRRHAQRYYHRNIALLGDAAHTIHPLAGQGVNLGFQDVEALLAEVKKAGQNWSKEATFVQYQASQKTSNLMMQTAMDGFYFAFSNDSKLFNFLRNKGIYFAERSGVLKKQALKYALGLS